ncbi:MAG: cell wall hydrolase [Litoreibacter sp.]|nr:cell wall hydrolase [Litoreibacter sp.]
MIAALVLCVPGQTAVGQGVASASNDPAEAINTAVLRLASTEKSAMSKISARRISSIARPLERRTARGVGGEGMLITRAALVAMPKAEGDAQWKCLSEALYFEARGESVKGQVAVAEVILNRVASPKFPNTVCRVVNQGTGRKFACQFTYTCDGYPEIIRNKKAHELVGKIARLMLDGAPRTLSGGATFYHTTAVNPRWARKFRRTAQHGVHLFYARS